MDNKNMEIESEPSLPKRKYYIERDIITGGDKLSRQERNLTKERSLDLIMKWPKWDIWPFKISAPVVGITAAASGYFLNSTFRSALLLGHHGRTASYLATMGVPAGIAGLTHTLFISSDILQQETKCPVCLQVRSASIQLAIGLIYPALFVPLTNFSIASGIKGLYFPKIQKQPGEVLKFAREIFSPIRDRYLALGALQIIVAMGITYLEQQCYFNTLLPILNGEKVLTKDKRSLF